jgi:D-alanyl-D-alanine carboxypeptidase-like protein
MPELIAPAARCFVALAAALGLAGGVASAQPATIPSVADLVTAYPDQFSGVDGNFLLWRDGTRMPISDGRTGKDFDTLLDHPDIDDMFVMPYQPGPPAASPGFDEDPGRIRYEPLFAKMYGDCSSGEVARHMRRVAWMPSRHGGSVMMTTVNGAADHLEAVVRDLGKLPDGFTRYLVPSAGTYNCRAIAGTNRRSMHAYGAAIDINTKYTDYWLWSKPVAGKIPYRNRIPFEIVDIFERHGFIWGGKWYHYDTMHFEYRPELLKGQD